MTTTLSRPRAGLMAYELSCRMHVQTLQENPWQGDHPLIGRHDAALEQARRDWDAAVAAVDEAYGT